jgi:hypothetical protein
MSSSLRLLGKLYAASWLQKVTAIDILNSVSIFEPNLDVFKWVSHLRLMMKEKTSWSLKVKLWVQFLYIMNIDFGTWVALYIFKYHWNKFMKSVICFIVGVASMYLVFFIRTFLKMKCDSIDKR